jgi:hypothetical protein
MLEDMKHTEQHTTRTVDVTGLPEEAVRAVEALVSQLRGQTAPQGASLPFSSRQEWIQAIRAWAASHKPEGTSADWSRESIYAGRGE